MPEPTRRHGTSPGRHIQGGHPHDPEKPHPFSVSNRASSPQPVSSYVPPSARSEGKSHPFSVAKPFASSPLASPSNSYMPSNAGVDTPSAIGSHQPSSVAGSGSYPVGRATPPRLQKPNIFQPPPKSPQAHSLSAAPLGEVPRVMPPAGLEYQERSGYQEPSRSAYHHASSSASASNASLQVSPCAGIDGKGLQDSVRDVVVKAGRRLGRPAVEMDPIARALEEHGFNSAASLVQLDHRLARELRVPLLLVQALQEELRGEPGSGGWLSGGTGAEDLAEEIAGGGGTGEAAGQPSPPLSSTDRAHERHLLRQRQAREVKERDMGEIRISATRWEKIDDPWLNTSSAVRCRRTVIPSAREAARPPSGTPLQTTGQLSQQRRSPRASPPSEMALQVRGTKNKKLPGHVLSRVRNYTEASVSRDVEMPPDLGGSDFGADGVDYGNIDYGSDPGVHPLDLP